MYFKNIAGKQIVGEMSVIIIDYSVLHLNLKNIKMYICIMWNVNQLTCHLIFNE